MVVFCHIVRESAQIDAGSASVIHPCWQEIFNGRNPSHALL